MITTNHTSQNSTYIKSTETSTDVVIIQQYPMIYFGVISLDAHLREAGYRMDVLVDALESNIVAAVEKMNPRIVGFSVFSTEHHWLIEIIRKIRRALPSVPIIVGGVHAMIYPEQILKDSEANFVCCSDGEGVLLNVLNELSHPQPDFATIAGLVIKTPQGYIMRTNQASLVPFDCNTIENRDVYCGRYPTLARDPVGYFISGRGCPYSCNFCYNSYLREAIGTKDYLRRKDPDCFIREIELAITKFHFRIIFFVDDIFTFDKEWLRNFLPQYKQKINFPFACMTRADVIDEETAQLIAEAGCHFISFGIETGNQIIRNSILDKKISDQQMIACGTLLRKCGMIVRASNMFCLPHETVRDAFGTIALNIESKVDLVASMLLIPYPQTAITEYMKKKGLLAADYSLYDVPLNAYRESIAKIPDKAKIKNTHYLSYFFVKHPWLFKRFKWVVHLTWLSPLYYCLFLYSLIKRNKIENRLTWIQTFTFAWRKKSLFGK
ncbi:B12-binding domain-containing radical SAM protein [Candidatus Omnitrophota bacterium]